ncbi:helix-turn-helix domain-containing protein [Polaribacter vadi]|uniref:helix-turn-helix domain-containing protein n=1 Tax=Polaribacter TaxID=52959 RepID=UPI001C08A521|nr:MULTISPECIES: helix-turn-helix domain-containing protein [Polaribacter]MBU3011385.1 helix-turn-helix domain-containing protein [Polaribacter vadi]MDO6741197.1 helix-turn-helix domain-containing protein [Polaribacter sp. 1_MG-2023]
MNIEIVSREEFNSFKQEVLEALKPIGNISNSKKYLRSAEVRKLLNISAGTLQNMRINGDLPYTRIGSTLFYDYSVILEILEKNSNK